MILFVIFVCICLVSAYLDHYKNTCLIEVSYKNGQYFIRWRTGYFWQHYTYDMYGVYLSSYLPGHEPMLDYILAGEWVDYQEKTLLAQGKKPIVKSVNLPKRLYSFLNQELRE